MFTDTETHRLFAEQRVLALQRAARRPDNGAGVAALVSRLVGRAASRRHVDGSGPARPCPQVSTHP